MRDKGITASELARKAGLTRDNISTYTRSASLPNEESLRKLARALDTTPGELLPNRPDATYSDQDQPTLEITQSLNQPGKAHLRIDRLVSFATAAKIAELLQNETAEAPATG